MLIKMLVGKRKTEDEFKKYITRVACSLLSLGVLGLFIIRSNSLSDYALGLVLGLTMGFMSCQSIILRRLLILNVFTRCILLPMMSEINRF